MHELFRLSTIQKVALNGTNFKSFVKNAFDDFACVALSNSMWLNEAKRTVGELCCKTFISHFIREEKITLSLHHCLISANMDCIDSSLRAKSGSPRLGSLLLGYLWISRTCQSSSCLDCVVTKNLYSNNNISSHSLNHLRKVWFVSMILVKDADELLVKAHHGNSVNLIPVRADLRHDLSCIQVSVRLY